MLFLFDLMRAVLHLMEFYVAIQFARLEDARTAQSFNRRFEIAGRIMKVHSLIFHQATC